MARSVRVLWIDRSPTDMLPALHQLEQAGYSVIHELIQNPETLKAALYTNEWDLAVCANDLPDFNPLTALQLLQQAKCPPPLLVLDRTGSEVETIQLLEAGAATSLTANQLGRLVPLVQRILTTTRTAAEQTDRLKRELFLRESQFQRLFDNPGIAICELDFSALDAYLKEHRAAGIGDFKIFFDLFPDEVDACARKIKILAFNQRCVSLLQFKNKEDFLANFLNNVFFETLQVFIESLIAFANGTRTIETEFPIRSCSGKTIFLACSMTIPENDEGETTRTIAFLTDITKRHQAEKALVESRDKLELLVDIMPVGISVLDINHNLVKANRTLEEILGLSFEDMARGYPPNRRYFRPDGTRKPSSEFASTRVYHGEERVYHVETGVEKEDGSLVWADVSGAAFPFSDWSTVLVTADITRRVETELQNQKLIAEMRLLNLQQEAIIKFTSHLRESKSSQEAMEIFLQDALTIFSASFATIILNENGSYHAYHQYSNQPARNEKCVLKDDPYLLELQKSPGVRFNLVEAQLARFILSIDPDRNLWHQLPKSNVLVPILSEFEPAGFMVLGTNSSYGFSQTQEDLLLSIATIGGLSTLRMRTMEALESYGARRAKELETLYNVISVASQIKNLKERLDFALEEVCLALDGLYGGIFLYKQEENRITAISNHTCTAALVSQLETLPLESTWEGWIIANRQILILPSMEADPRCLTQQIPFRDKRQIYIGAPIEVQGKILGVLWIVRDGEKDIFSIEEITFFTALANHIGVIIENYHLIEQGEESTLLEERSRLAHELHDSVTQTLYSAAFFAEAGYDMANQGNLTLVKEYLARLSQISQQALKEMRLLIYQLRPEILRNEGLIRAIQHRLDVVENKVAIATEFSVSNECRLSDPIEDCLYWVTIEALNNIAKHAQANHVWVTIQIENSSVYLKIQDNGIGFTPGTAGKPAGFGVNMMQERLRKIGGTLEINSNPQTGTTLTVTCPNTA